MSEDLYDQWCQVLRKAHEEFLQEHLGVSFVDEEGIFTRTLEALLKAQANTLTPAQRLRFWRRDTPIFSLKGTSDLQQLLVQLETRLVSTRSDES
jgi:5'-3' exonuclease